MRRFFVYVTRKYNPQDAPPVYPVGGNLVGTFFTDEAQAIDYARSQAKLFPSYSYVVGEDRYLVTAEINVVVSPFPKDETLNNPNRREY